MAMARAMVLSKKEKALLRGARSYIQLPLIQLPTSNETRLEDRLSYFHFIKRNVVQDEHSFFRTMSDQLFGTEEYHHLMRHLIATQLRKKSSLYRGHVSGDYNSFCDKVAANYFGDVVCAMAVCDLFAVLLVLLLDTPYVVMNEFAPTEVHDDEEQVICRKVIYSCKSGNEMHSMVPFLDHHLDDSITRMKAHQLEQNLHNPNVILEICNNLHKNGPKTIVPKGEYERLSQRLHFFRFQRKEMIGDGNCLFRTISDQIYGYQEHHSRMRSVIVAKLKAHPSRYRDLRFLRSSETYDGYCRRMAIDKEWGDTACLQAACDAFGVKIMLLDSRPKLIFREFEPDGPCKKVIYGCINSHHMDTICPLAELSQEESEEGVDEMEIDFRESLIAIFEERMDEIERDLKEFDTLIAISEESAHDEIKIDKRDFD